MRRRYPILRALLAQGIALAIVAAGVVGLVELFTVRAPWFLVLAAQSALAVLVGRRLGLAKWWLVFQAAFAPALLGLHALALPPWAYLTAFLIVLLLNWNSFRHGVPLYLTSNPAIRRLAEVLHDQPGEFRFIDLGCGLAGPLCQLARCYPRAQFTGVETAPLAFALAWLRALPVRNCRIRYRNLWRVPLAPYEVVYCFLSPLPMPALWQKAQTEMRPGTLFISNTFGVPGVSPQRELALADWRGTRLLVWQMER